MKQYLEILRACPLFEAIADEKLHAVLGCLGAKTVQFEKGQTVLAERSPAGLLGIVLSGCVQIERVDYNGNRSILTRLYPKEMMAESFACSGIDALPIEAVATEASTVMLIDAKRITKTCSHACEFHNRMIYNLLKIVSKKNILLNQKLEVTSKRTTREKLMAYLCMEAKKNNSNSFTVPYSRQELADYLEVDRSGLSAHISRLRSEGVLRCRRSEFTLLAGGAVKKEDV